MLNEIDIHMLEHYVNKKDVIGYTNLRTILSTTVAHMTIASEPTPKNPKKEARLAELNEFQDDTEEHNLKMQDLQLIQSEFQSALATFIAASGKLEVEP